MKIIDAHCHFWDVSLGLNPWLARGESELLGDLAPLNQTYLPCDYLSDVKLFTIEQAVHVEAASACYAKDEVQWLDRLSKSNPLIAAVVAGVDLLSPTFESLLSFYSVSPLVKGVRQILNWHEKSIYRAAERADDLRNPLWRKHFRLLAKYGLSFDLQICPGQMLLAAALAKDNPDVMIILNHAGMPIQAERELWEAGILVLASCENVVVKLSGFGMWDHQWSAASVTPWVRFMVNAFGLERCLFASNFPVDKLYCDFPTLVERYQLAIPGLSETEKHKLFYDNARSVYRTLPK
ncbi:MAG: amidohydrolase [Gammaproteobacteria bacterium CG11_big_fil_rev_8_21_14_0_20_46_22]|nr:MAG: amidohydrolase [Gammaproteobacteria bacterium CG12_big_fil_rev_8_21_14_0_65_46_12]PIR10848.1 MAG: amidohydrolase [Gammaproteobacteria bacterium CG11_big_fil_rev_8_21_14_0_20_46_22]